MPRYEAGTVESNNVKTVYLDGLDVTNQYWLMIDTDKGEGLCYGNPLTRDGDDYVTTIVTGKFEVRMNDGRMAD